MSIISKRVSSASIIDAMNLAFALKILISGFVLNSVRFPTNAEVASDSMVFDVTMPYEGTDLDFEG